MGSPMEYTDRGESEIIYDVLLGLALAVIEDEQVISDGTLRTITNTKLEKFVYMAVDEFDLPVTYSWYLAGAKAQSPTGRRDRFKTAHGSITGQSEAGKPVVRETLRDFEASAEVRTFADFFGERLQWLFKDKYEFLADFYEEYAPSRFEELYLKSHELRILLDRTVEQLDESHAGTIQTGLSSFDGSSEGGPPDHYEYAGRLISNIHMELADDEILRPMLPAYQAFTDILEDAFMKLAALDVDDLSPAHIECFAELSDFHYNHAWQYPCLRISIETASGPRREEVVTDHVQRLETFEEGYHPRLENKRELCLNAGLSPKPSDYPERSGSDLEVDIAELTHEYLSPD